MLKPYLVPIILFLVLAAGIYIEIGNSILRPPPRTEEEQLLERERITNGMFSALESIRIKTGDAKILEVMETLSEKATPAIPTEEGLLLADNSKPIRFIALIREDARFAFWDAYLSDENGAAFFAPSFASLIVKNTELFGDTAQGVLLFHEGYHVLQYLANPALATDQSDEAFCADERDAHFNENVILQKLGGQPYSDFIARKVEAMAMKAVQKGKNIVLVAPDESYRTELAPIFGPWKSDKESIVFANSVWTDVMFRFVDTYGEGDQKVKNEMKEKLLCSFYARSGALPSQREK